jgi:hypothetical protein
MYSDLLRSSKAHFNYPAFARAFTYKCELMPNEWKEFAFRNGDLTFVDVDQKIFNRAREVLGRWRASEERAK